DGQRGRGRSGRGATPRERLAARLLEDAGARRGRRRVHGEAAAEVPAARVTRRSFRDRFLTPPVARAITSPTGILLAGAGASAAILVGLPLAAIIGVG